MTQVRFTRRLLGLDADLIGEVYVCVQLLQRD